MSKANIAGVARHLPQAAVSFDGFHVIQLANTAVDEVRRAEVRDEPVLKHSRWTWLKDKHRWSKRQITTFHTLSRLRLKTARAWRLKETLREIFKEAGSQAEAEQRLKRWYSWESNSGINHPGSTTGYRARRVRPAYRSASSRMGATMSFMAMIPCSSFPSSTITRRKSCCTMSLATCRTSISAGTEMTGLVQTS